MEGVKDATELLTQRTSCLERNTPLHLGKCYGCGLFVILTFLHVAAAMSEEASYSKTVDFPGLKAGYARGGATKMLMEIRLL